MMRLEKQSTPRHVVGYKRGFNLNIVESYQSIVKVQLKAFSVIRYVENWVLLFQNCWPEIPLMQGRIAQMHLSHNNPYSNVI